MGTSVGVVGVGTGGHQLGGTEGCAPLTNFGIQQGGADSMCPPHKLAMYTCIYFIVLQSLSRHTCTMSIHYGVLIYMSKSRTTTP